MRYIILLICSFSTPFSRSIAQQLKPGFDLEEYTELIKISARHGDTAYLNTIPEPQRSRFVYRSPEMGLDNHPIPVPFGPVKELNVS